MLAFLKHIYFLVLEEEFNNIVDYFKYKTVPKKNINLQINKKEKLLRENTKSINIT
jgi:hypothetical protein